MPSIRKSTKIESTKLSTPHGALGTVSGVSKSFLGVLLSTPHGALGTHLLEDLVDEARQLSTPHGALGTEFWEALSRVRANFQLHTVHQERGIVQKDYSLISTFNSTRCIRNEALFKKTTA